MTYNEKLRIYENEKRVIAETAKDYKEYQSRINALVKKLKI